MLFFLFLAKSQLNLLCSVSGTKITLKDGGIAPGKEGKMKRLWNIFLSQGTIFLASSSLLSNIVLNSLWGLKAFIKMTIWSLQRQRWRGTKKISKCIFMLLCSFFLQKFQVVSVEILTLLCLSTSYRRRFILDIWSKLNFISSIMTLDKSFTFQTLKSQSQIKMRKKLDNTCISTLEILNTKDFQPWYHVFILSQNCTVSGNSWPTSSERKHIKYPSWKVYKVTFLDFSGGPLTNGECKNPAAKARDTGLIPGAGRFQMPQALQPLKPVDLRACALQ